jgi:hypothetical protein
MEFPLGPIHTNAAIETIQEDKGGPRGKKETQKGARSGIFREKGTWGQRVPELIGTALVAARQEAPTRARD